MPQSDDAPAVSEEERRHYQDQYGAWSGNPMGSAPDFTRCCESVYGREAWSMAHQCHRPRGHGPDGAYCKQHDPAAKAKRQTAADEKYRKQFSAWRVQHAGASFLAALRVIAAGHNDPRTLAADIVTAFDSGRSTNGFVTTEHHHD